MVALTCLGFSSKCLQERRCPRVSWRERGAPGRVGDGRTRAPALLCVQSPERAASSLSGWILQERKRKRLVGAATPGGVGRGGGVTTDSPASGRELRGSVERTLAKGSPWVGFRHWTSLQAECSQCKTPINPLPPGPLTSVRPPQERSQALHFQTCFLWS